MAQNNSSGTPPGTVTTPVGAQWPSSAAATPGSTDFGLATDAGELAPAGGASGIQASGIAPIQPETHRSEPLERTGREVVVAARPRTRPSATAVISSALLGAAAGTAIPFMLAGRKSETRIVEARQGHEPSGGFDRSAQSKNRFGRRDWQS